MTPASSAPGGAWPSRIEGADDGAPAATASRKTREKCGAAPPDDVAALEFSSGVVETIGQGRSKPSPGAVGAGSGRTRVGFWRPGRIVRADTPGGLGGFRVIPRFRWRYDRVRGGTILPGRHFSLRAGPRGLEREPDETHGASGGRAPPGRPVFRERAGFQSNAQMGGARSSGNLRARGGQARLGHSGIPAVGNLRAHGGAAGQGGGQRVPGAVTKSMSSSMRPSRAGSRSL